MELNEIAGALAKAQLEMSNPKFDAQNPHFKNRFASLAAVRNAVVPVLARHGISLTQDLKTCDAGVSCTTILTHSSGQQMVFGPLVMPVTQMNSQQVGSAGTYAKRYSMQAVAAVVGDDDDDAEAAVGHDEPRNTDSDGMSHPSHVLTNAKREIYLPQVVKCLEAGDAMGFKQLIDELNEGERRGLWFFFSTKQKAAARDIMQDKAA